MSLVFGTYLWYVLREPISYAIFEAILGNCLNPPLPCFSTSQRLLFKASFSTPTYSATLGIYSQPEGLNTLCQAHFLTPVSDYI